MTRASTSGTLQRAIDQFAATTAESAAQIDTLADALEAAGWQDTEALAALADLAHRLAGTGGTLGFGDLAQGARALEHLARAMLAAPGTPGADARAQADLLARHLAARSRVLRPNDSSLDLGALVPAAPHPPLLETPAATLRRGPVLVLGLEAEVRQTLQAAGFVLEDLEQDPNPGSNPGSPPGRPTATRPTAGADDPDRWAPEHRPPPWAVVVDVGTAPDADRVALIADQKRRGLPVLAIGGAGTFLWRVRAHRLGADAYLVHAEANDIADRLLTLGLERHGDPTRVLILDDDPLLAGLYAGILTQAGMEAKALARPEDVLEQITYLAPDVLVTDLAMPHYSGVEVAAALRFGPREATLPIVALARPRDQDQQGPALAAGVDLLLSKPLLPETLVSAVHERGRRGRQLRDMTLRDCMTGLLNHTALFDYLGREMTRARRSLAPLSLVLIDLDHFKAVNDRHGHHIGDIVILTLARLIRRRLRKSDLAGRCGGEEFALVLPATPLAQAVRVTEALLEAFRAVPIPSGDQTLSITFSAGVTEWQPHPPDAQPADEPWAETEQTVFNRADRALYAAKRLGRNRVVAAPVT